MAEDKINPEPLKRFAVAITEALKELDSELLAYQQTLLSFKQIYPTEGRLFEVSLELAKQSAQHQGILRERYDKVLEQFQNQVLDEEYVIKAVKGIVAAKDRLPN